MINLTEADSEQLQDLLNAVSVKEYEEVKLYSRHVEILNRRDPAKENRIKNLQMWITQISTAIGIVVAREKAMMN